MSKEMRLLKDNEVWELTTLPPGKKAISSIERYKARLVARGFDQKFSTDYDEIFCPVVHLESLRTLIALSTQSEMELHHVDVAMAFLNGSLQEEV